MKYLIVKLRTYVSLCSLCPIRIVTILFKNSHVKMRNVVILECSHKVFIKTTKEAQVNNKAKMKYYLPELNK